MKFLLGAMCKAAQCDPSVVEGPLVDWRVIEFTLLDDSAPCGTATLLRPAAWVEENHVELDAVILLDLPELGISGAAQVEFVDSSEVASGPGRPVTDVFRYNAAAFSTSRSKENINRSAPPNPTRSGALIGRTGFLPKISNPANCC